MSSPGTYVGATRSAAPRKYFCYQCDRQVDVVLPPSLTDEIFCPNCGGGFLEESETVPQSNPTLNRVSPNGFTSGAGGASYVFSSGGGGDGFRDLSGIVGSQSPDESSPFAFFQNYFGNVQASGPTVQFVFNSPGGGGGEGGRAANLGDYFLGPGLEQLIQQLSANDPNRYGAPPASRSAVGGLPDVKITKEILASDSSQCAICKDSFKINDDAKQIPCKHLYHSDCILPWLELHNSCPVCRYELPTDDPNYETQRTGQSNNSGSSNNGGSRNINNTLPQIPVGEAMERVFRISFPWSFREVISPAEASNRGGNRNNEAHDAREEDLD